ncbi:Putative monooxygenase [BD1-7 clade bacterium]|uniref:Nitronate monooxygenase n=1 Tax=BD1-7 clade bacterium TaxID=2029982 RepID=A0A5S9PN06_9GAMM|nr:Putative monooxygenase [BD1-7 clade bacterium]
MSFQQLFNANIPIIQAPMAGIGGAQLAVAVAKSGGLGSIPCGMLSADQAVAALAAFRRQTDAPCNLNFFCHPMPSPNPQQREQWQQALLPYYRTFGLSINNDTGTLRQPFSNAIADALEDNPPEIVSFHFGLPENDLLDRVKRWGCKVLSTATTVEEGRWLEDKGADAVIAQGAEAGGHRGMFISDDIASQIGILPLTSQLIDALSVPVIAAGGIGHGRDIHALMQLGAVGVQIGTAYMLCDEADTRPIHRELLQQEGILTAITNVFSGKPARGMRNQLMKDLGDICDIVPDFPYASADLGPLRTAAEARSLADFTPLWSGQNRSGCQAVSATQLTENLWLQATTSAT